MDNKYEMGEPPCAPFRVSVAMSANRLLAVELTGASSNELNTYSIFKQRRKENVSYKTLL